MSQLLRIHPSQTTRASSVLLRPHHRPQSFSLTNTIKRHHQPPSQTRSFHVDIPSILHTTQTSLVAIHAATGIPWVLLIPCFATAVAVVFRLPFTVFTRRIAVRRSRFTPLLQAWTTRLSRDVKRDRVPAQSAQREAEKRHVAASQRIYGKLGLGRAWALVSFLGMPGWLVGIETVRSLSGGSMGLLGMLVYGPEGAEKGTATGTVLGADGTNDASSSSILDATASGDPAVVDAITSSATDAASTLAQAGVEASLTIEGALWFTNLTVPDPYGVLPIALSALLVMNALPTGKQARAAVFDMTQVTKANRTQVRWTRAMLCLGVLAGPLTMKLPAAVHVFWISSSAFHWITQMGLRKVMPIRAGNANIQHCSDISLPMLRPTKKKKVAKLVKPGK